MEILVAFILVLGIMGSLITSGIAYSSGRYAREKETRWRILYGDDCYNNTYIMPFSIVYDLGYASYDKGKARSKRNKEKFNRK